ncbi:E3 ubiquitin-protein ligase TRIM35-like [Trichomycterus rosablanca]|uniref:E3 ubiquitin-protein ligase TRIM35-like n=1 Tax=Trichomycterus rosablanca TaxID=2290929 RepID=UPI002F35BA27
MASSHSEVEKNLKCSICSEFFTDPVVLSCSHSFCTTCINRNWSERGARECPLCRKKSKHAPCKSLAIKEISEAVMKKRRIFNEGEVCGVHGEKYELFCTFDQKLVCLRCVSDQHQDHNFCSISKAAEDHRNKLRQPLLELQAKLTELNSKASSPHMLTVLHKQTLEIERQMRHNFYKLRQFLLEEENVRIAALKNEEQEKRGSIKEKMKESSSSLSERIRKIKEDMKGNETLFLHNFRDIENRAKLAVQDLQTDSGSMMDAAKHLGNLKFNVWEKMKGVCPYYSVILDQNTKIPSLDVHPNLASISCWPLACLSFSEGTRWHILGSEGFDSGVHSWQVEVEGWSHCRQQRLL